MYEQEYQKQQRSDLIYVHILAKQNISRNNVSYILLRPNQVTGTQLLCMFVAVKLNLHDKPRCFQHSFLFNIFLAVQYILHIPTFVAASSLTLRHRSPR